MRSSTSRLLIVALTSISVILSGCAAATPTAAPATATPTAAAVVTPSPVPATATPVPATATPVQATATAVPATDTPAPTETPAESPTVTPEPSPTEPPPPCDPNSSQKDPVVEGVEANATITFWTFYLSPTFDPFINCTIARFEADHPGVKVNHEDHQGTYLEDYRNAISAGTQPDVANLSNNDGWVREFAQAGKLMNLTDNAPKTILDQYFPNLLVNNIVEGKNYQFPWYQAIAVELINKKIFAAAGIDPATFPKKISDLPALCTTLKAAGTVCDIRLTVNDYLAQMVYEGGVKVISDDGKTFTFDSPEAVKWLQMYVDMVKAGTVDTDALTTANDRIALLSFSAGQAPFYQTGPQLIRVVKENNPDLYDNLALAALPLGESGVTQPDSQGIAVKKDTPFPNASLALAAYFTGPRAMLDFAKIVPIYPSTPASYDDPFFATAGDRIEDSVRPLAKDIIANESAIAPDIPKKKDVNDIVRQAVESALFGETPVPAQDALTDAVKKANELIAAGN